MQHPNLSRLFDELNLRFFGGRLPKYRVVPALHFVGEGYSATDGVCDDARRIILLRRGLDPVKVRRVLLHEMCHAGLPKRDGSHGRRWQARMLRAAEMGETWAAEEVEMYRTRAEGWHDGIVAVKSALFEFACQTVDDGKPKPNFWQIVRVSAGIMHLRPTEARRKLPWLRGAWRKALEEADWERRLRRRLGLA